MAESQSQNTVIDWTRNPYTDPELQSLNLYFSCVVALCSLPVAVNNTCSADDSLSSVTFLSGVMFSERR